MAEDLLLYGWGSAGSGQALLPGQRDCSAPHLCSRQLLADAAAELLRSATFSQLLCSGTHTLALTRDGTIWCWGDNSHSQCGLSQPPRQLLEAHRLPSNSKFESIAVGWWHSLAIAEDGSLYSWGHRRYCGSSSGSASCVGRVDLGLEASCKPRICACGFQHSLVVMSDNTIYGWGHNRHGQLGVGDLHVHDRPVRCRSLAELIGNQRTIVQLSCGRLHSLALTDDGVVWSVGSNSFGQLGRVTTGQRCAHWQRVPLDCEVTAIASGWSHCLALDRDGIVYCWGRGDLGQLGVVDERCRYVPAALRLPEPADTISQVFCGSEHSLCLSVCRTRLYVFGWNEHGNLGLGSGTACESVMTPQLVPFFVEQLSGTETRLHSIATGGATVLAILQRTAVLP